MDLKFLLWEIVPSDKFYITTQHIEKKFHTISIKRDNNYRLFLKLEGQTEDKHLFSSIDNKIKPGQLIQPDEVINAQDEMGVLKVIADGFIINNISNYGNNLCSAEGEAFNVKFYYDLQNEIKYINYWFLNCEQDILYTRVTKIDLNSEAIVGISGLPTNKIMLHNSSFISRNSILLSLNGKQFVFGMVDKKDTNDYPGSYMRFDKSFFPSDDELNTIQNVLSFVIGKIFIPIGFTKYNESFNPIEKVYKSSFRSDINHVIDDVGMPPIPIDIRRIIEKNENLEEKISNLLDKYHKYKNIFQLDQIIWYINIYRLLPLDIQLQPLSTALDILQKVFFQSDKSFSKGKYPSEENYGKIISKYIENIKNDLKEIASVGQIINKINRCNEMSNNEKYKTLFEEIGLKIGDVEDIAIKERNVAIHGSLKPKDYQKVLNRTRAYYTLLMRLILKILEYDGVYIDYSTYGFPVRNINESLGGSDDDGKI